MLKQRVITALVLVAILFGALAWSPLAFAVLMAAAFALAQAEWLQLAGWKFSRALGLALVLGTVLVDGPGDAARGHPRGDIRAGSAGHRRMGGAWCRVAALRAARSGQDPIGAVRRCSLSCFLRPPGVR